MKIWISPSPKQNIKSSEELLVKEVSKPMGLNVDYGQYPNGMFKWDIQMEYEIQSKY